jgi:hypothetical protein
VSGLSYRKAVSRVLAVVLIVVVLLAAAGAAYLYYGGVLVPSTLTSTTQAAPLFTSSAQGPAQFTFSLEPPFCHAAPGGGAPIRVFVNRSPGFSGAVRVELANPPSWVIPKPLTLNATNTNATLLIGVAKDAPKTQLTLTVRASAQGSADQTASLDMKVVAVSTVTSKYGGALVYETTKILDSETLQALTSYSMDKVVFSKMTTQLKSLERGDVMSAPPPASPLVPAGFFLTVLSVREEGGSVVVETRRASLLEAVQEIQVGRPPSASGLTAAGGAGMGPSQWVAHDVTIPVYDGTFGFGPTNVASDGGSVEAKATVGAKIALVMALHLDWLMVDYAYIHISVGQWAEGYLKGTAGSELKWVDSNLGEIFPTQDIPILDGVLWIEIAGTWEGRASGQLAQDVNLSFKEAFNFQAGPLYNDEADPELSMWCKYGAGQPEAQPCSGGLDLTKSVQETPTVGGGSGSNARVGVGPRLQLTLNAGLWELAKGYIGGFISANLFFEFDSNKAMKPRWWVDAGIDAWWGITWGLSILGGLASWDDEWSNSLGDLLRFRLINGPYENAPPVVAITSPADGSTIEWSGLLTPFTGTATDSEDGNVCGVWTVEGVQIGTGCTVNYGFSHEGDYHITFTATDSEAATTAVTVLVHVKLPKPIPVIERPTATDTVFVQTGTMLQGYAKSGLVGFLECDKLTFTIEPCGPSFGGGVICDDSRAQTFAPHPSPGGLGLCQVPDVKFPSPGLWAITLTAKSDSREETAWQEVNVNEMPEYPPPNVMTTVYYNLVPNVKEFRFTTDTVTFEGIITSNKVGDIIKNYRWYSTYIFAFERHQTIAEGELNQPCSIPSGCTVHAELHARDYCENKQFNIAPGDHWLTVALEAYEGSGSGPWQRGENHVTINLLCLKPLASQEPPFPVLLWTSWGVIVADRKFESWPRLQQRLLLTFRPSTSPRSDA